MAPWSHRNIGAAIIAPAQVMLEPYVKDDERVAAAHLLEPELGHTVLPVGPGDRHDRVALATDHRFEGKLDGQVEVM